MSPKDKTLQRDTRGIYMEPRPEGTYTGPRSARRGRWKEQNGAHPGHVGSANTRGCGSSW